MVCPLLTHGHALSPGAQLGQASSPLFSRAWLLCSAITVLLPAYSHGLEFISTLQQPATIWYQLHFTFCLTRPPIGLKMLSIESRNGGLPQSEPASLPPSASALISEWLPEDIEDFFCATKLCTVCQIMLGPDHLWKASAKHKTDEALLPGPKQSTHRSFEHHVSYESLHHSLELGWHI